MAEQLRAEVAQHPLPCVGRQQRDAELAQLIQERHRHDERDGGREQRPIGMLDRGRQQHAENARQRARVENVVHGDLQRHGRQQRQRGSEQAQREQRREMRHVRPHLPAQPSRSGADAVHIVVKPRHARFRSRATVETNISPRTERLVPAPPNLHGRRTATPARRRRPSRSCG